MDLAVTCVFIVVISGVQFSNGGVSHNKHEDYIPIKYPGPIKEDTSNRYGAPDDVPEQCRNLNYCTIKPKDYPQEKFNQMFRGTKPPPSPSLVIETVADRQGEGSDNCESDITYEPFYKIRSTRGDWRVVVQAADENYVQVVRLENCMQRNSACFKALPSIPGVTTFCKQKFSVWEFLVETENNGTERVKAELPICCSCHYKIFEDKK